MEDFKKIKISISIKLKRISFFKTEIKDNS